MAEKAAKDLQPGVHQILVDRMHNPSDMNDYADVWEQVIVVEEMGPCLRVYTETSSLMFQEDKLIEVRSTEDGDTGAS